MKIQPIKAHQQEPVITDGARGARIRVLIGPAEGAGNFHMRHFEIEAGGCTPHHTHDYEHEILVLKGSGVAKGVTGERPFKTGDVIYVPAGEPHQFCNPTDQALELICLIPAPCKCTP